MPLLEQETEFELSQCHRDAIEAMTLATLSSVLQQMDFTIATACERMRQEISSVVSLQGPSQAMKVHQSTSTE